MRWRLLLLVGGLAPLAGCHLAEMAVHNSVNEPTQYLDEKHLTKQLRHDAKEAFHDLKRRCGHKAFTEDFEDGFIDGYADTLERGGDPIPPAVPPLKYRRGRFLNPEGHARIRDYFTGFQQGGECAIASGKRQFLTVPVLLSDPPPEVLPPVRQVPKELCGPDAAGPGGQVNPPAEKADKQPAPLPPVGGAVELTVPRRPLAGPPPLPAVPPAPEAPLPDLPKITAVTPAPRPAEECVFPRPDPEAVVRPQPEPAPKR